METTIVVIPKGHSRYFLSLSRCCVCSLLVFSQPVRTAVESLGRYYYCLYRSSLSSDLEIRRASKSEGLPLRPGHVSSFLF